MPGFNEEDMARTPLYELYRSGRRFRLALPTLVRNAAQGKVTPVAIDDAQQAGLPNLDKADAEPARPNSRFQSMPTAGASSS